MSLTLRWSTGNSPAFSASQSGTTLTVRNTSGYARIYDDSIPVRTYDSWTVWATINGTKIKTVSPYVTNDRFIDLFDINEQSTPFSFSMTIPDNLLGQTITVSFIAKKVDYTGDSGESSSGAPSFTVSTVRPVNPSISWNSGSKVTAVVASNNQLTATLSGGATIGGGASGTVYYRVWCDNTRKNSDGSTAKTWTFAPTAYDVQVTIKVQAYFTYNGTTYTTGNLTCTITVPSGNYLDYFDGENWIQCKAYYYDGTQWVECKPFYYDGTGWVEISS